MGDSKTYITQKGRAFWQAVFQFEAGFLSDSLSGCRDVLSIGCGTGLVEGMLVKQGYKMVCLDLAIDYLLMAPQELVKVHGRAESLPFAAKQFDAVIAVASVQFMEDQQTAIREACRVLRDKGRLVLMLLNPASSFVAERMTDPQSYFSRMRQTDPSITARHAAELFELEMSYALGLKAGVLSWDEDNSEQSQLCILRGEKRTMSG